MGSLLRAALGPKTRAFSDALKISDELRSYLNLSRDLIHPGERSWIL